MGGGEAQSKNKPIALQPILEPVLPSIDWEQSAITNHSKTSAHTGTYTALPESHTSYNTALRHPRTIIEHVQAKATFPIAWNMPKARFIGVSAAMPNSVVSGDAPSELIW